MRRKAFQNRQRLTFTDTGKNHHIHLAIVLSHIHSAREDNVRNSHNSYHIKTFLCIRILILPGSHDPELQSWFLFFRKSKSLDQCLNILDRSYTKDCTDIDLFLFRLCFTQKILESLHLDTIWYHHCFLNRAL